MAEFKIRVTDTALLIAEYIIEAETEEEAMDIVGDGWRVDSVSFESDEDFDYNDYAWDYDIEGMPTVEIIEEEMED